MRKTLRRSSMVRALGLPWVLLTGAGGLGVGVAWWLLAPGGAFYGDVTDYATWLARDLAFGALCIVAGIATAVLLLRSNRSGDARLRIKFAATIVGSLLGSVLAWRMGVFAGDLFHVPPANMANPSMVFSLRAASVLFLWPLAVAFVVFVHACIRYALAPVSTNEPVPVPGL